MWVRLHSRSQAVEFQAGKLLPKFEEAVVKSKLGLNVYIVEDRSRKEKKVHVNDLLQLEDFVVFFSSL